MLALCLTLIDEPSDREKFQIIYDNYKDIMYYKAMQFLHNKVLADEAVQESFLKIAKHIQKISEPVCSKTLSFVVIIVRTTVLDKIKIEHPEYNVASINDSANFWGLEDKTVPNIEDYITENGYNNVIDAISKLEDIYSDTLKLKFVYGYSNQEISNLCGVTLKTTEMRIYRGKKKLKTILEEQGYAIK